MATVSASTTTISCLCRTIAEPGSLCSEPILPLQLYICHCDSCRHSSGALMGAFVKLHSQPSQESLNKCIEYVSSEHVSRFFCRTCGSHIFFRDTRTTGSTLWYAWAASIDRADTPAEGDKGVDSVKTLLQVFLKDSKDGGLVQRMAQVAKENPEIESNLIKNVYSEWDRGSPYSLAELTDVLHDMQEAAASAPASEKLAAKCHCGAVQYYLTRPDPTRKYSDFINRYIMGKENRWKGRPCWCRSCCVSTGDPFHPWAYAPPEHIFTLDGQPVDFVSGGAQSSNLSGIKQYKSSEPVTWSFCGTCGATVFYENADRPWAIDIGVGILRSSRGALAEDYVSWVWNEEGLHEESRNHELLEGIVGKQ